MTTATDSKQVISDLSDLIKLEYDAMAAYQSAIEKFDKAEYKEKLTEFLGDHKKHVQELGKAVGHAGVLIHHEDRIQQQIDQFRIKGFQINGHY